MTRRLLIGALTMGALPIAALAQSPGKGLVIILLGPPGAGKTTQAQFLKKRYRIPFLSAAEIVRKSRATKSKATRGLEPLAASGELLSDDALNQLMLQSFQKSDFTRGFILDGYPANRAQAEYLSGALRELRLPEPAVVLLDVPDSVARQRMTTRGRAGDEPAIIERRLADYTREIAAVRESYPPARVLRVDGTKPEREISSEIEKALETLR
jgi:adenylate kinase